MRETTEHATFVEICMCMVMRQWEFITILARGTGWSPKYVLKLIVSDIGWPRPAISRNLRPKLINVPSSHEEYPEFQTAKPTSLLVLPFELEKKLFLLCTCLTKQSRLSLTTTRFYRRERTTKWDHKDLAAATLFPQQLLLPMAVLSTPRAP